MLIYRTSDKISVTIDNIEVKISPLSHAQKTVLTTSMVKAVAGDMDAAMQSVRQSFKYCLKDIKGVFYLDDDGEEREYKLAFDTSSGELTDDSVDDVLNMPISTKLNSVCAALLQGVPDKILDDHGQEIKGIKIKKSTGKQKKK